MKFPVTIRHRTSKAKIYAPAGKFAYYRVAYTTAGKRRMQTFAAYPDAKAAAERIAREMANGSQAASLTASQSRDALAALERLATLHQTTGRKYSLLGAVSELAESVAKLNGRSLVESVEGYLGTVVSVKRKSVTEAVEEFIASRQHKTKAKDGKRAQLSETYAVHVNSWLREFAGTFPGTAVCDLSKEHLAAYAKTFKDFTPKTRNHRRATVKMFLKWCVRQDYLPVNNRLLEADCLACEVSETADTDFFRPAELQKLLDNASTD
ncbi:MAG: hypothetical protein ABSE48_22210, partial [Verrucomicrobiota bacterium]